MLSKKTVNEQSLLFAKLSLAAYDDGVEFEDYGYSSIFLSSGPTQLYFMWDYYDVIIVARGTQAERLEDIIADLELNLVPSSSRHGEVHAGFKRSVDLVWMI